MNILIVTGGMTEREFALGLLRKEAFDVRIIADSALQVWDEMGEEEGFCHKIDHLVGDFDSVFPEILEKYINSREIEVHRFVPEKDYTDTDIAVQLAIRLCRESGDDASSISLLGATGTRLDHTLANLHLLIPIRAAGITGYILNTNNRIRLMEGEIRLSRSEAFGDYFSLIPVSQVLRDVSITGAKYPLAGHTVQMGESICVSNEFAQDEVRIRIGEGTAFLIESRD